MVRTGLHLAGQSRPGLRLTLKRRLRIFANRIFCFFWCHGFLASSPVTICGIAEAAKPAPNSPIIRRRLIGFCSFIKTGMLRGMLERRSQQSLATGFNTTLMQPFYLSRKLLYNSGLPCMRDVSDQNERSISPALIRSRRGLSVAFHLRGTNDQPVLRFFLPGNSSSLAAAFARTRLTRLLAPARTSFFAPFIFFVYRRPRSTLGFLLRDTTLFVTLLDVFRFPFLLARVT